MARMLDGRIPRYYSAGMRAKKIAISLSPDALEAVDRYSKAQGISRSAWFERAARRAQRQEALSKAIAQARAEGIKAATDKELDALRRELALG